MEQKITIKAEIKNLIENSRNLASEYPDEALKLSEKALSLSIDLGDRELEGYALISKAFYYRAKSEVASILDSSLAAFHIFDEINDDLGKIKAMNLIGISYFYTSMYDEAMRNFLDALKLSKQINDTNLETSILNNIAEIYRETKSYDKAFENYNRALNICKEKGYHLSTAVMLSNIGDIYMEESRFDEALKVFYEGINTLQNSSDLISLSEIEGRIGRAFQLSGDMINAKEYYEKALDRITKINNKYYAIDILCNFASLFANDNPTKSMNLYSRAIDMAREINANSKIGSIYRQMAELQESHGNFKKALEFYKLYSASNDKHIAILRSDRLEILNVELKYTKDFDQLLMLKNRFQEEINLQKLKINMISEENQLLEKRAYEDELTGIPNRRSIKKRYYEIVDKIEKGNKLVALYMIDIDDFKRYNDCWGHPEGDKCLIGISKCIEKICISRGQVFGRYGGEEFVYIAELESIEKAFDLGEEIRKSVERLNYYYEDYGSRIIMSISIGVAVCMGENCNDIVSMLEEADRQLYISKKNGKNQVNLSQLK